MQGAGKEVGVKMRNGTGPKYIKAALDASNALALHWQKKNSRLHSFMNQFNTQMDEKIYIFKLIKGEQIGPWLPDSNSRSNCAKVAITKGSSSKDCSIAFLYHL